MASIITHLRVKIRPSISYMDALAGFTRWPPAPSRVPAGQIYLQKAGSGRSLARPKYRGTAITNTARIPYFSQESARVIRLLRIFGTGILWSSSWIRPIGHSQPQIVRPSTTPKSMIIPSTYQPAR